MKTFPIGGVHPSENKLSCAKPIEVLPLPEVVNIPLAQHIGAPAVAKVAKGDKYVEEVIEDKEQAEKIRQRLERARALDREKYGE